MHLVEWSRQQKDLKEGEGWTRRRETERDGNEWEGD